MRSIFTIEWLFAWYSIFILEDGYSINSICSAAQKAVLVENYSREDYIWLEDVIFVEKVL